jgi:hypothetical protein
VILDKIRLVLSDIYGHLLELFNLLFHCFSPLLHDIVEILVHQELSIGYMTASLPSSIVCLSLGFTPGAWMPPVVVAPVVDAPALPANMPPPVVAVPVTGAPVVPVVGAVVLLANMPPAVGPDVVLAS